MIRCKRAVRREDFACASPSADTDYDLNSGSAVMLGYAVAFMIIALIAGAMGFGLVGGMAYGAAKICFFVFLVLAVVALIRGRSISV